MTYETLHGLQPANDFLNAALRKDSGTSITLRYKRVTTRRDFDKPYHVYWIQREDDSRLISIVPYTWQWKNNKTGPEDIMWPLLPLTIYPEVKPQHGLRRLVHFRLSGLENVQGLTLKPGLPWAWAFDNNSGYFSKNSPLHLEYRRRLTIETADLLQKEVEIRIKKHQALGPFMLD